MNTFLKITRALTQIALIGITLACLICAHDNHEQAVSFFSCAVLFAITLVMVTKLELPKS